MSELMVEWVDEWIFGWMIIFSLMLASAHLSLIFVFFLSHRFNFSHFLNAVTYDIAHMIFEAHDYGRYFLNSQTYKFWEVIFINDP